MKTSSIIAVAAATAASAQYTQENGAYKCDKPNASYCLGGDIILRCDANGNGTPGRCSDNLAGYPPLGGVAECYQSAFNNGDAACEKNCVVYAATSTFTLDPDVCYGSATATATGASSSGGASSAATTTTTTTTSSAASASATTAATGSNGTVTSVVTQVTTTTSSCSTSSTFVTYASSSAVVPANTTTPSLPSQITNPGSTGTGSGFPGNGTGNGNLTTALNPTGPATSAGGATHTPVAPSSGPAASAPANSGSASHAQAASGLLAMLGLAVTLFL